jgi:hypothetical protein
MKNLLLLAVVCLGVVSLALGFGSGATNATGSASADDNAAGCATCHTSSRTTIGYAEIGLLNAATWAPNESYTVRVRLFRPDSEWTPNSPNGFCPANDSQWGFSASVHDADGNSVGELWPIAGDSTVQRIVLPEGANYIGHSIRGTRPTELILFSSEAGQFTGPQWTFNWKSPAESVGPVTLTVSGIHGNCSGSERGDTPLIGSRVVPAE